MYRFVRSIATQPRPGGPGEAYAWAKEIAAHFGQRYGMEMRVMVEVFGEAGRLYWVTDYEDLAAIDRMREQLAEDRELGAIVARGAELTVAGTLRDRLLRHL